MNRIRLCKASDIADPGAKAFEVGEGDWPLSFFVVRQAGLNYGYVNRCPHAGHQLNWVGDRFLDKTRRWIQCASHGAAFEIESGICVGGPCPGERLDTVPVIETEGVLFVDKEIVRAKMPETKGSGFA